MKNIDQKLLRRVKRRDAMARVVITLGGVTIIASVILILLLIAGVTLPLTFPARVRLDVDQPYPSGNGSALPSLDGGSVAAKTAASTVALRTAASESSGSKTAEPHTVNPPAGAADAPLLMGVERVELADEAGGDSLTGYAVTRGGEVVFWDLSPRARLAQTAAAVKPSAENALGQAGGKSVGEPSSATSTAVIQPSEKSRGGAPGVVEIGRLRLRDESAKATAAPAAGAAAATATAPHGPQAAPPALLAAERSGGSRFTLAWADGSASLVDISLTPKFDKDGRRSVSFASHGIVTFPPLKGETPSATLIRGEDAENAVCARLLPGNRISVVRAVKESGGLFDEAATRFEEETLADGIPGPISAMTLDDDGRTLYVGTSDGQLALWEFDRAGRVVYHEIVPAFADKRAITALAMVRGGISLAVGDERGGHSVWFTVRRDSPALANGKNAAQATAESQSPAGDAHEGGRQDRQLRKIHELSKHRGKVIAIEASQRNKSLISLDATGAVHLDHVTSDNHLFTLADAGLERVGFAPRTNALIGYGRGGALRVWSIDCPHPDVSWRVLFGKVHYEGYAEPRYIWQSGSEEPKMSLVPIIFGTWKATFYAMILAIPLALLSAIYVAYFTTPAFRNTIKPIVEMMAAVPSVVIGFLILLWLAPLMGTYILAAFLSLILIPACFVLFMAGWQLLRKRDWAKRVENGYEFIVLAPVIVVGGYLSYLLMDPLQDAFFGGNFTQWLYNTLNMQYEPLNSMVVAFGLAFAVIPIIFSMAEDALSSIPGNLTAASLALGSSRWQTLRRVILPSASPGIFAAIMIGFGRCVGETMIVFMAAGNTPILDWSPFNGFRTLSANLAVEMPEAPKDSSLYRVLFLCAVLLFLMTFLLNTIAELVRQNLRKRYGRY